MSEPAAIPMGDPEIMAYECKLTVEAREGIGGDWERNVGGTQSQRRVTFEGWASPDLYGALIDAVRAVSGAHD